MFYGYVCIVNNYFFKYCDPYTTALGKKKASPKTFRVLDKPVLTLFWTRRWLLFLNTSYHEIFCFRFFFAEILASQGAPLVSTTTPPPSLLSSTLAANFATDTVSVIDATGANYTGWKFAAGVMCNLTFSYSSEINAVLWPQRVSLPLK